MEMGVGVLDHYNVSTRKFKETVQFYEDVLGFMNGPRPELNFPGAWLYSDGHAVLHLNDISQTDSHRRPDTGVINHVAFRSRGFGAMKHHLQQGSAVSRQPSAKQYPSADFPSRPQQRGDRVELRYQK